MMMSKDMRKYFCVHHVWIIERYGLAMKSKLLNDLLLMTFICTLMVPLTGVIVHKLASTLFLLLCVAHTLVYRKQLNGKYILLLGLVAVALVSGIFGMIFEETPLILAMHKVISIALVFWLAIHIFVFHKRLRRNWVPQNNWLCGYFVALWGWDVSDSY